MIVLMVSAKEAESLIAGKPDQALRAYVKRELIMENLLPDDNLPETVTLTGLELSPDGRHYIASVTYASAEQADQAWELKASA